MRKLRRGSLPFGFDVESRNNCGVEGETSRNNHRYAVINNQLHFVFIIDLRLFSIKALCVLL